MSTIPELPENLWPIRDATIDHILNGNASPDLQPIYDWLEDDGHGALVDAWSNEEVALDFDAMTEEKFNDDYLADNECIDPNEITDTVRLNYARAIIKKEMDEDNCLNPSLHSYELKRLNGDSIILGCMLVAAGQAGNYYEWAGLFKSKDQFYESIRKQGYVTYSELEKITDNEILLAWSKI